MVAAACSTVPSAQEASGMAAGWVLPPCSPEPGAGAPVPSPRPAVPFCLESESVCAAWVFRGQPGEPGLGPELLGCGSGRLEAAAGVGPGRADAPCPLLSPESKLVLVGWIVVRGCVINSKSGRLRRN